MITDSDLFCTVLTNREVTEDGDWLYHFKVTAKGFEGVRAYNKERSYQVNSSGRSLYPLETWTACGKGFLTATFTHYVDGVVVAMEARNDARSFYDEPEGW